MVRHHPVEAHSLQRLLRPLQEGVQRQVVVPVPRPVRAAGARAAVLAQPQRFAGRNVGLLLSGGNVDLDALPWMGA